MGGLPAHCFLHVVLLRSGRPFIGAVCFGFLGLGMRLHERRPDVQPCVQARQDL
jgi:hypothetical protein